MSDGPLTGYKKTVVLEIITAGRPGKIQSISVWRVYYDLECLEKWAENNPSLGEGE